MQLKMKSLSVLLAVFAAVSTAKVSYDGFKVYRLPAETETSILEIEKIVSSLELETWKMPRKTGTYADVVVPPGKLAEFQSLVEGKNALVMHENLADSIEQESTSADEGCTYFSAVFENTMLIIRSGQAR